MKRPVPRVLAASVLWAALASGAWPAAADRAPSLLEAPAPGGDTGRGAGSFAPAPAVRRWRRAGVRLDVLMDATGSPRAAAGHRIGLSLFADADFTATLTGVTRHPSGSLTWSARLDGVQRGSAVLAVHDRALVGTVLMPGAVYRIGYAPDGTQVVEEIDQSALPREADAVVPVSAVAGDSHDAQGPAAAADTGAQIDVMVVYTAAARTAAGGTAAMQAEAAAAVASANQAYANNGLVQRLRLVFAGEVTMAETGNFDADLDALRVNAAIGSLRDAHGADLVSLLTSNGPSAAFCGIGYLMTTNSAASFAPYGFSLVERDCASANLTFVHELGHNMGAHHDPYVAGSDTTLFPYSHGYVDLVGRFRTIMAYNNQCADAGFGCTRIPYVSTPNLTYGGRAMGTGSTSDNARTLGQTADTVANLRQAVALASITNRDFNGDGKADILWRHTSGGVVVWLMNGAAVSGSASAGGVATDWAVAGVGDFNGDAKADILWRHTSGGIGIWFMNGAAVAGTASAGGAPPDWSVAGVGDFNGDGKADILLRHTTGGVTVLLMNGATVTTIGSLGGVTTDWTVAGVGDFNGDGKADILWRHTSGGIGIWFMNGTAIGGSASAGGLPSTWTVQNVADFNGDGKADILWRHVGGGVTVWLMNGAAVAASGSAGAVPTDWTIVGARDFNGDGKADVLWRHTSGGVGIWFMNGTGATGSASAGGLTTDWTTR